MGQGIEKAWFFKEKRRKMGLAWQKLAVFGFVWLTLS